MKTANPIYGICKSIRKITEAHFSELQKIADDQRGHLHPLKIKQQHKINDMGKANHDILIKLREIQEIIKSLKP